MREVGRFTLTWYASSLDLVGDYVANSAKFTKCVCVLFAIGHVSTNYALAFDVDGFRSGMTEDEAEQIIHARGLESWEIQRNTVQAHGLMFGNRLKYEVAGSLSFCRNQLMSYIKDIDFDADYVPTLHSLIREHGQPNVRAALDTLVQGGGHIQDVKMAWYFSNERIELTFWPQHRKGNGDVAAYRGSSINYASRNECWKQF